jgi:3,4-dihydroxy 2-butanone 4-phosphate synthase/GTP cyclohydrolase II
VVSDVFGDGKSVHRSLARFKQEGRGVLVYLRDGTAGVPVTMPDREPPSSTAAARERQWREIGLGAQILRDLGISSIRLLASRERTYVGLSGFGIEIVATETLDT